MIERIEYHTDQERGDIIADKKLAGITHVGIQLHNDGNFLLFDAPDRDYEAELDAARDLAEVKTVLKDYIAGRR